MEEARTEGSDVQVFTPDVTALRSAPGQTVDLSVKTRALKRPPAMGG